MSSTPTSRTAAPAFALDAAASQRLPTRRRWFIAAVRDRKSVV